MIDVEGEVCDALSPITSAVLNGTDLSLEGSGECRSFSTQQNSNWGLNVLYGLVVNESEDEVAFLQSYLRSGEYFVAPTAASRRGTTAGIPGAFRTRLGQDAIDDGDRNDNDDLVSVINLILQGNLGLLEAKLNAEIPDVIYKDIKTTRHECLLQTRTNREGVIFSRDPLTLGEMRFGEFWISEGEVGIEFQVGPIELPFSTAGYLDRACLGERTASGVGTVGIGGVTLRLSLLVETVEDVIQIRVGNLEIDLGPAIVDVELDGLIGWFDGFVSDALTFVGSSLIAYVEPILDEWLRGDLPLELAAALKMDVFSVEELSSPKLDVTVVVETATERIDVGADFIDYGITVNASPTETVKSPEQLEAGTIIGASSPPTFDDMTGSYGLGIKHDFINQVFWAYWAGGAFDFDGATGSLIDDLNAEIPEEGVTVTSLEMNLPPVLMPGDTESTLRIGVGELKLIADVEQTTPSLFEGQPSITITEPLPVYASVSFTVAIGFDQQSRALELAVTGESETHVQIVDAIRNDRIKQLEEMFAEATAKVTKSLIQEASVSIKVPALELHKLGVKGIPEDLVWVIDDGVLDQTLGYLRILGSVGVEE